MRCGKSHVSSDNLGNSRKILSFEKGIILKFRADAKAARARLACRTQNDRAHYREDFHKIAFVTQSMHRSYAETLSLEKYARMCNTSKFHFLRMFERVTGETSGAYRNKIRMEHAKEMLEEGILSVGDIGRRLGYDSPSPFCDAFKKETGCSPLSYRRRMKT